MSNLSPYRAAGSSVQSNCIYNGGYTDYTGSACVAANADCNTGYGNLRLAMIVNENQDKGYTGFYAGSRAVVVPNVRNTSSWFTGVRAMHLATSGTTELKIRYYNANGTPNGSLATRTITGEYGTLSVTTSVPIPANFNGSMVITSDRDIVVSVIYTRAGSTTETMITNAVNR